MPELPVVLIVGNPDRAEMRGVMAWFHQHVENDAHIVCLADVNSIQPPLLTDGIPDLILVFQAWSEEYSASDVGTLFSFAPLARIVVCYGAWCESDGRTRDLWPLSVRVPVWAAVQRIEREWRLIRLPVGEVPLPWSASREEVYASDLGTLSIWDEPQQILIDSPDPNYSEFLEVYITGHGHSIDSKFPTAVMFDGDPWGTERANVLSTRCNQYPQAEVILLTSQNNCVERIEWPPQSRIKIVHKLGLRLQNERNQNRMHSSFNP